MRVILLILAVVFGLFLFGMGLQSLDLFSYGFFAPKYEAVKRKVFEETPSYVQGKVQDLASYKLQYERTKDPAEKDAIRAVIRRQFSNFNEKFVPDELRGFLHEARGF